MTSNASWPARCREYAETQATREARQAWKLTDDQPLPLNQRWEHVQEVVRLALWLAEETGADREIIEAAAWLHDIHKGQRHHAMLGAAEAERFLPTTDFPPAKIPAVAEAIRQHEGLERPAGALPLAPVEVAVLWDADKLSKIGVQALAFLLSASYMAGRTLGERRRDCADYVHNTLTRTVTSMNTAPAQHEAQCRHADMVLLLTLWQREESLGDG
jgi:uncharacterized protein